MTPSESEVEGAELDRSSDGEDEQYRVEDDLLDNLLDVDAVAEDATEGDESQDSASDDSDDSDEDGDADDDSEQGEQAPNDAAADEIENKPPSRSGSVKEPSIRHDSLARSPTPPRRVRSLSPAQERKRGLLLPSSTVPLRSYTVEAICALPHPTPTHALSASFCMTHMLTGSEDGYIRDYDIFSAVNGKMFLTAPQRQHCGVVEGILKAGQIRLWWENPGIAASADGGGLEEPPLAPVYSMITQSDALWSLAGSDAGHINLFTLRHEPGRLSHVMSGHRGPVSAMSMQHDEKGFFSAGWDGEALQWDLNTGQIVRNFTAHGAQLAGIAVRPLTSGYYGISQPVVYSTKGSRMAPDATQSNSRSEPASATVPAKHTTAPSPDPEPQSSLPAQNTQQDADAKSDISSNSLFDDEDADGEPDDHDLTRNAHQPAARPAQPTLSIPTSAPQPVQRSLIPPKNAPPLLDPPAYATFSSDILMTASIDGQVILWDKRVSSSGGVNGRGGGGVGRLWMSDKTPPWCLSACWSADGGQVYAGRRNGTVDVWDVRQLGISGPAGTPRLLKTLRNPASSGVVSCVVAFPDGRHIACASVDNIRLWNAAEAGQPDSSGKMKSGVQFKIIPGHHGGYVSQMIVDPAARFLVSASSNRGWHGDSTRTVFVHDVKHIR